MKERAFAFIGINRDTKCYIFNMFFFLYSSSFVFYLKCKLVRPDVPFVFKVLSDFRYRSATSPESHVEFEETDVFI